MIEAHGSEYFCPCEEEMAQRKFQYGVESPLRRRQWAKILGKNDDNLSEDDLWHIPKGGTAVALILS
jgi:hypothetical protein